VEPDSDRDFDLCKVENDIKSSQSTDDAQSLFFTQSLLSSEKLA